MAQIYLKAIRCWWMSLPVLLVFSALAESLRRLPTDNFTGYAVFVSVLGATGLLIWFLHRHFLYDEALLPRPQKWKRRKTRPLGHFMLVFMALNLLAFVPATLLHGLPFTLLYGVLYLFIFSLFGAELPAAIDGDPRYSMAKALRQAPRMAGLLLTGPGLSNLVLVLLENLYTHLALPFTADRMTFLAIDIVRHTLGFFPSILAAATFCHVYRRIVPDTTSDAGHARDPAPPRPTA